MATADYEFDLYVANKLRSKADNAKARGIEFKMTFQSMKNLLKAKHCYYTGVKLTKAGEGKQRPSDMTIDRIDPNKGYVTGNVVACCFGFNQLKSQVEHGGVDAVVLISKAFLKASKRMASSCP
jgi:repressor of nif and glnA expression